jgi:hypothetical protein
MPSCRQELCSSIIDSARTTAYAPSSFPTHHLPSVDSSAVVLEEPAHVRRRPLQLTRDGSLVVMMHHLWPHPAESAMPAWFI